MRAEVEEKEVCMRSQRPPAEAAKPGQSCCGLGSGEPEEKGGGRLAREEMSLLSSLHLKHTPFYTILHRRKRQNRHTHVDINTQTKR